jgi:hypothetical protein
MSNRQIVHDKIEEQRDTTCVYLVRRMTNDRKQNATIYLSIIVETNNIEMTYRRPTENECAHDHGYCT